MEIKQEFEYRLYWRCICIGLLIVVFMGDFRDLLFRNMEDFRYHLISLVISFIVMFVYIQLSKNLFIRKGSYLISGTELSIVLNGKQYTYEISEINEVCCMKKNWLGIKFIMFGIKHNNKWHKIFSKILSEEIEMHDVELYNLYSSIKETGLFIEDKDLFWLENRNIK